MPTKIDLKDELIFCVSQILQRRSTLLNGGANIIFYLYTNHIWNSRSV